MFSSCCVFRGHWFCGASLSYCLVSSLLVVQEGRGVGFSLSEGMEDALSVKHQFTLASLFTCVKSTTQAWVCAFFFTVTAVSGLSQANKFPTNIQHIFLYQIDFSNRQLSHEYRECIKMLMTFLLVVITRGLTGLLEDLKMTVLIAVVVMVW